eukprot:Clim_evm7s248 gene=Clim_evmTU7s248
MSQSRKLKVMLAGGTGFIGSALKQHLRTKGHEVVVISRISKGAEQISWDTVKLHGLPDCDVVINAAGAPVLQPPRRWTETFKREVIDSRVNSTSRIRKAVDRMNSPPKLWVNLSGAAYYPPAGISKRYTESDVFPPYDFMSQLVSDWEGAMVSDSPTVQEPRKVVVRSGVVLGNEGGAFPQQKIPLLLGVLSPISPGSQPFPWIHIQDMTRLLTHIIEQDANALDPNAIKVYNACSPDDTTNDDFTYAGARHASLLSRLMIPLLPRTPQFVFSKIVIGTMDTAVLLLKGQNLYPQQALDEGFKFDLQTIDDCMRNLFGR